MSKIKAHHQQERNEASRILLQGQDQARKENVRGTSHLIARGKSIDLTQKLKKLQDELETDHHESTGDNDNDESRKKKKERIQAHLYLGGKTAEYHHLKRKDILQQDDQHMKLDTLHPYQQRALLKRQKRAGESAEDSNIHTFHTTDKVLKASLERKEIKRLEAAIAATDAEQILNTVQGGTIQVEHEMEKTYKLTQQQLKFYVDEQTSQNIFDLNLEPKYCPYGFKYDRSGLCGVLYSHRNNSGHVSILNMQSRSLQTEFFLHEKIRDATFLHNPTLFAVAQQKHVFIYDDAGVEIHRLSEHQDVFQLQFLPYHWLLATVGRTGFLKYHDTSTGTLITTHRTKLGPCDVMAQNPSNAVIHLGHHNGIVTLWSPASSEYLVKMLCHKGSPIRSIAIDRSGHYMVTGGADSQVKIWDLRMFKETHAYYTKGGAPSCMDISQKGILGIGHGCHTTFWPSEALKYKVKDPYMNHELSGRGPVETIQFRPYEDVCAMGHSKGLSSIVIPGSGDPNLDSMEYNTNPYQDKKQRREAEVRALLDKLSPDMIALDPDVIGTVEVSDPQRRLDKVRELQEEANARKEAEKSLPKPEEKKRMRGRSKIAKKLQRKQKNIIDTNLLKLKEAREAEKAKEAERSGLKEESRVDDTVPIALKRFLKK